MKVNPLLMDIVRGEWLMGLEGLTAYAPIAYKLISGEEVKLDVTGRLLTIYDKTGAPLATNDDGLYEEIPEESVAIVHMIGPVIKYGDWCTYGADEIAGALRAADNNPNIKFTILVIDGPGGSVAAIGPLLEFARTKKKPVIGMADQCCSLHFWTLVGVCDYKLADNDISALFGSVGVVLSLIDNKEYLEKLGYKFHEIYPEESKHKNEAFRLLLQGKYDMIKEEHHSPLARKFQAAVKAGCPNLKADVTGVLTGKTFSADKALEYGMINGIGGMDKAMEIGFMTAEMRALNK